MSGVIRAWEEEMRLKDSKCVFRAVDGGVANELKVETRGQANSLPESRGASFDCLVNRNKTPFVLAMRTADSKRL